MHFHLSAFSVSVLSKLTLHTVSFFLLHGNFSINTAAVAVVVVTRFVNASARTTFVRFSTVSRAPRLAVETEAPQIKRLMSFAILTTNSL